MLTPIYPVTGNESNSIPMIHYFTKEWVKLGYEVKVLLYPSNFPLIFYPIARLFRNIIETRTGITIRTYRIKRNKYTIDGIDVNCIPLSKNKPHGRYKRDLIEKVAAESIEWCESQGFKPDVIIGHWINPQMEIMNIMKNRWNVPTCLSLHDAAADFKSIYRDDYKKYLDNIDILGFRSKPIKERFFERFKVDKKWLYCFSGIPNDYITGNENKSMENITNFIYIGRLIARKFPAKIIEALASSEIKNWNICYIGEGNEEDKIKKTYKKYSDKGTLEMTGLIKRIKVREHLKKAQVFVMISKSETFGFVYIEAMGAGCITIASKGEGFDGIIEDGVNGFLCTAGDENELASIFNRIKSMSVEERELMSRRAVDTAKNMTENKVAKKYIDEISRLL